MANSKISALTSATTPLAGTETLPIVQGGATVKVAVSNLTAGRAVSAASVTDSALTSGRVTYAGASGLLTDSATLTYNGTTLTATTGANFVTTSGSVGVGTSSPQSKLTVAGTAPAASSPATYPGTIQINETALSTLQAVGGLEFRGAVFGSGYGSKITSTDTGDLLFGSRTNNVAWTERMQISSSGIVTMSAYGAGAATFSAAGVISSVSDETWKVKDGAPVDTDAMLKKLEPGYWYYNDEKKDTFGADRQLGFYAQNVNAAIGPEAAPEPEEGKPWGYYDRSVLAVTVMSLQKALATIESLKIRLAALENK